MAPLLSALRGRYLTGLTIGYFAVTSFLMAMAGGWPTPDKVVIVGLVLAFLVAKPLTFLKDWMPFVFLLAAYEYLRGLVPSLGWAVHVQPLILADEFLFGRLPTVILQDFLFVADHPTWYDYVFTLTYLLHFTLPLGFALLLWTRNRTSFRRFITALTVLSFAAFLTYLFYPAMPPWLASYDGIIPPLHDVMVRTTDLFKRGPGLPTLYAIMSPNMVAAMPSLHAAYPMLDGQRGEYMGFDLSRMTSRELLGLFASVMEALRDRGVVRTGNNPVADYAELLVCRAFGLEAQTNSNQGFDALDATTGERYEVKGRRVTVHSKPTRVSPLRDFDKRHFDYLVIVVFTSGFGVDRAAMLPWESVAGVSSHNEHLNGRIVFLRDALWSADGVEDVTDRLRAAETAV